MTPVFGQVDVRVGVDCEAVARFRRPLRMLAAGEQRVFTEAEHAVCRRHRDPAQRFAARWCAKEAIRKALPAALRLKLREIELDTDADHRPRVVLPPRVRGWHVDVSWSHTPEQAFATAVAWRSD